VLRIVPDPEPLDLDERVRAAEGIHGRKKSGAGTFGYTLGRRGQHSGDR
jgi:hypothetical protein